MPNYPNIHAYLENDELHVPKDFSLAEPDSLITKNANGEIQWTDTWWQPPVIALVNGLEPPPNAVHGDRYILVNMGTTVISASVDTSVSTSVDTSVGITVDINGLAHDDWQIASLGDIAEYYQYNNDGNIINKWLATTPKQGYRAHHLGNDSIYYFDGNLWQKEIAEALVGNGAIEIREIKTTVSSSEVLSLKSFPLELVAAPGVGKAIEVISAIAAIDTYGGSIYESFTTLELITQTADHAQYKSSSFLESTAARKYKFEQVFFTSNTATQMVDNQALLLSTSGGDPVGGNSDIIIYLTYRIVKL